MTFDIVSDPAKDLCISASVQFSDKILLSLLSKVDVLQHFFKLCVPLSLDDFNKVRDV
jgi:hypothetical protein